MKSSIIFGSYVASTKGAFLHILDLPLMLVVSQLICGTCSSLAGLTLPFVRPRLLLLLGLTSFVLPRYISTLAAQFRSRFHVSIMLSFAICYVVHLWLSISLCLFNCVVCVYKYCNLLSRNGQSRFFALLYSRAPWSIQNERIRYFISFTSRRQMIQKERWSFV